MGLLDDAIRDHLELKRRHGADPSEVARQEQEAFGPARDESPDSPAGDVEPFDAEDEDEPRGGGAGRGGGASSRRRPTRRSLSTTRTSSTTTRSRSTVTSSPRPPTTPS